MVSVAKIDIISVCLTDWAAETLDGVNLQQWTTQK